MAVTDVSNMKRLAPNFGQKLNQTLLDLKSAQESIGMVYLSSKCSPSPIGYAAKNQALGTFLPSLYSIYWVVGGGPNLGFDIRRWGSRADVS